MIQPMEEEEVFNWYLEDLGLKIDDLRNRSILDVGGGMIPNFAEYCLKNGITEKIYTIDSNPFGHEYVSYEGDYENPDLEPREGTEHLESKKHYIQAKGEAIPLKKDMKFDLILMRASLNEKLSITSRIDEALLHLQLGGELRIAPVFRGDFVYDELKVITNQLSQDHFEITWDDEVVKRNVSDKVYLLIIKKIQ